MRICKNKQLVPILTFMLLTGCNDRPVGTGVVNDKPGEKSIATKPQKTAASNFAGTRVPVLCYHAIREPRSNDSPDQKTYSVSPGNFSSQIKALSEHGYTTITPDQLRAFLTAHQPLPKKPVMITFDDGRKEQYTIAAPVWEKYHFKGVFFIMTVTLGKQHYMNRADIKALADRGHIIGCHYLGPS